MPLSIIEANPSPPPSPPRLTLESLQHPSLQPSAEWPARRMKDFVQTQKNHSGYYSRLGASYYQNWEELIDQPIGEGITSASGPGPSAFATPILKPRAPRPALAHPPPQEPSITAPTTDVQPEAPPERANPQKAADDGIEANLAVSKSREVFGETTNTNRPVNSPKKSKRQAASAKEPDTTKVSESNHDEHEQRLAERRERRRAKREIVKPPPPPPSSSSTSGSSVTEEGDPSSPEKPAEKKKDERKNKKGRKSKSKIIPGISLMENFSAGNLGKERLTLKPTAAVGLFNQGRSSAHGGREKATAVPVSSKGVKGKKAKAKAKPSMTDLLFSEFAFLKPCKSGDDRKKRAPLESPAKSSRTKQRLQKKRIVVQEESESGESASSRRTSNVSPPPSPSKARPDPTRKKVIKGQEKKSATAESRCESPKSKSRSKTKPASKLQPSPPSNSSDTSGPSLPSPSKVARREQGSDAQPPEGLRYLSPPWEIDGDIVGDLVPVSETGEAKTRPNAPRSPSPSVDVSEKVIVVSGKWGLTRKDTAKETREPQLGEETKASGVTIAKNKSTKGTRSRFFPASRAQEQSCTELVESTNDVVLLPPRRDALLRSLEPCSTSPGEPRHTYSEPLSQNACGKSLSMHEETKQVYFDSLPVMNHAPNMDDKTVPTLYYHPPSTVSYQGEHIPGPEHFSISSRVASPDFDPAEDFIPAEYIIPSLPGFEQGPAFGGELPLEPPFNAAPSGESFYLTRQDFLQQTGVSTGAQRLFVPQGVSAGELVASPYFASSTSVVPGYEGLGYTHFEADHSDHCEEAYYDEEDNHDRRYQQALQYRDYDFQDHGRSLDDGDRYSQFDQVPMEDAGDQFISGDPHMLNGFAYLDDSIEYHYVNQRASRIPYSQEPQRVSSPLAQNEFEIGEEGEIDANGQAQDASPTSERLGSNFKHGRALLFGIQQVHDGGVAEVDAEFARQLWKR